MDFDVILKLFIAGAIAGLLSGAIAGAIVGPAIQAPDTLGRGLLVGILLALGVAIFELVRLSAITGTSMGSIMSAFQGGLSGDVGAQIYRSVGYVAIALFGGVVIGLLSAVPDKVLKGALFGVVIGAIAGGILQILMDQFNLPYAFEDAPTIFRLAVGLLTWGIMTAVAK